MQFVLIIFYCFVRFKLGRESICKKNNFSFIIIINGAVLLDWEDLNTKR